MLQSMGLQRVRHDFVTEQHFYHSKKGLLVGIVAQRKRLVVLNIQTFCVTKKISRMKVSKSVLWKASQPLNLISEYVNVYDFGKQFKAYYVHSLQPNSSTPEYKL